MGDVTALGMDVITEKSGHQMTPMAVSVCITPAAPSPIPLPYPVIATSTEGIVDPPMRTKINGAPVATVGSCLKACHGNEAGTLKEVVSLNTGGPVLIVMGAPIVLCELGMMGITGSLGISNKAPTMGAGANASDASGTGGGGSGAGGSGSSPGESSQDQQNQSNAGGSSGSDTNEGASGSSGTGQPPAAGSATGDPEPSDETRQLAAEHNKNPDDGRNADRVAARRALHQHYMDNHHRERDWDDTQDPPRPFLRRPNQQDIEESRSQHDFNQPVHYYPPPADPAHPTVGEGPGFSGQTPSGFHPPNWPWSTSPDTLPE
jgi:hypothetical protein